MVKNLTTLIHISLETNSFLLNSHVLSMNCFVNNNPFYLIWKYLDFYCALIHTYTSLTTLIWTKLEALFGNVFEFKWLILIADHWSCIHSYAFIILFSVLIMHIFCFNCILLDPLIPSNWFYHDMKHWCIYLLSLCV